MAEARHRRSPAYPRWVAPAALGPVGVLLAAAAVTGRPDLLLVAALAAYAAALLVAIVLGLAERGAHRTLARERADLAADLAARQAAWAAERAAAVERLASLVESQAVLIANQATRVSELEARVTALDAAAAAALTVDAAEPAEPASSAEPAESASSARPAVAAEWTELWPDLGDAPTVVDLLAWEQHFLHRPAAHSPATPATERRPA